MWGGVKTTMQQCTGNSEAQMDRNRATKNNKIIQIWVSLNDTDV